MESGFGKIRIEIPGRADDVHGIIANISHGSIHVRVPEFLSAKSVRVRFSENCHIDGQLLFCRAEAKTFLAGILFPPDSEQYRRSEFRVPLANVPAVVSQLEDRKLRKWDAKAVDISRSGLGLLVGQQLTANTWVKVELAFAIVFGEVMYSKPDPEGGYRVGLRMETLLMRDGRSGEGAEILDPNIL